MAVEIWAHRGNSFQFPENTMEAFASALGIAPGIVVGRLQKEGFIDFSWHNDLKIKYEIIAE